jgi:hypothetical protein
VWDGEKLLNGAWQLFWGVELQSPKRRSNLFRLVVIRGCGKIISFAVFFFSQIVRFIVVYVYRQAKLRSFAFIVVPMPPSLPTLPICLYFARI